MRYTCADTSAARTSPTSGGGSPVSVHLCSAQGIERRSTTTSHTYDSGSEGRLELAVVQLGPVDLLKERVSQDGMLSSLGQAAQAHGGVLGHELRETQRGRGRGLIHSFICHRDGLGWQAGRRAGRRAGGTQAWALAHRLVASLLAAPTSRAGFSIASSPADMNHVSQAQL